MAGRSGAAAIGSRAAMTMPVRMILFASAATVLGIAIAAAQTGAITAVDGDTVTSNGKTCLVGFDAPLP